MVLRMNVYCGHMIVLLLDLFTITNAVYNTFYMKQSMNVTSSQEHPTTMYFTDKLAWTNKIPT